MSPYRHCCSFSTPISILSNHNVKLTHSTFRLRVSMTDLRHRFHIRSSNFSVRRLISYGKNCIVVAIFLLKNALYILTYNTHVTFVR